MNKINKLLKGKHTSYKESKQIKQYATPKKNSNKTNKQNIYTPTYIYIYMQQQTATTKI